MLIVDAHLDIAYNAQEYGRDPLKTVEQTRSLEAVDHPNGLATVSFPEMKEGGVGLIFGTLFALPETAPYASPAEKFYRDAEGAHLLAMQQFDYYRRLADVEDNNLRLVGDCDSLDEVLASQNGSEQPLLGIVPLMEGADPIRTPAEAG